GVACAAGCSGDGGDGGGVDPPPPPEHGASWTVLVYMVADNNLEPFGLTDLEEMSKVGSGAGFDIVVQADRAAGYVSDPVLNLGDWQGTKRLHVGSGRLEEVSDIGEANMGDPATLADFIEWGIAQYPADRYALVLWDHGGAWPGFGGDESTANLDLLD